MNIFTRLYKYQAKRFPIKFLFFTTAASVLCSAAVYNYETSVLKIIMAFFAVFCFIFHVRVIDELRDFDDDAKNHPDNPIHNGIITIKQLFIADILGLIYIVAVSILFGRFSMIFASALVIFTTIASKDFFMRKFIVGKNVLYHIINSPQMILLQFYIFSILFGKVTFSKIEWFTVIFVYMNIFVLEVVRKIKIPEEESPVSDTYSKSFGFKKSLVINYLLAFVSFMSYFFLILYLDIEKELLFLILSLPVMLFLTFSTFKHIKSKTRKTQNILLLSVMIMYVGLNLLICLSVI